MATKDITVTMAERVYLTDLLSLWKGNVMTDGQAIMESAKVILLTSDEQKEMNYRQEGAQRLWDADKAPDKTLTLNQETVDYFLAKLKERDEAKETSFLEIGLVQGLRDKLN